MELCQSIGALYIDTVADPWPGFYMDKSLSQSQRSNYALRHAATQNYDDFYREEIRFRQNLNYPPFVALASILIKHSNYNYAFDNAQIMRDCLQKSNSEKNCIVLGPAPAPLARLKGEHRLQILVKARNRAKLRETIDFALAEAQEKFCDLRVVNVEIDPINLL